MSSGIDIERVIEAATTASGRRFEVDGRSWFQKTAADPEMLYAEADGLARLAAAACIRLPDCLGVHAVAGQEVLILEWLDLGPLRGDAGAILGRQLARQHRATADQHGLERDNFIGAGRQLNTPTANWNAFFRACRLLPLLDDLRDAAWHRDGLELAASLDGILGEHEPDASLLHGDLWAGNVASMPDGRPVIFDPAVHYGDRECDLAMTRLFGGFPASFYESYEAEWPLPEGWQRREPLYRLYHVLNHARLFGGGYMSQAGEIIRQLLG